MPQLGYALSSEEHGPLELVRNAARAEQAGFEFALISDHFHPWTDRQGESPFVWSVIGGIAQATERLRLGTGVTRPTVRTHPAIVAHARGPATSPPPRGRHYEVANARLYTTPDAPPDVIVAAGGEASAELAGRIGDGLVVTSPDEDTISKFAEGGGDGKPRIGQCHVCWAETEEEGLRTALEWFPNIALGGELTHEQPRTGDLARERFPVADREERIAATVHHQRRDRELGQALAPARLAVELGEHDAHLVGHLDRGLRARRTVPDALGRRARGGGVVAEDLRAAGGKLRHGGAVGPIGHRAREQPVHRRRVMVGQVVVDRAWSDGPRSDKGERRERVRVVQRGDLGDHPADADAREVRRPVVEFAGERRGIGCEIAQRVCRSFGINGDRRAGIARVLPHDVAPAARERLAERLGPGEHGRAAREQNERGRRVAEVLEPERDAVRLDRRHHASSVAMTPPDVRNEWTVGCMVNLQGSVVDRWRGDGGHRAVERSL